jgi:hypothetical protein
MRPLQFTPGQLRVVVGLSVETFRHWKRVLPPFGTRKGSSSRFSIGDLLAASILRQLTAGCGMRVGHLTEISKKIVSLTNSSSWAALEGKTLVVDLSNETCHIAKDEKNLKGASIVMLCPLGPIMAEVRDALLRSRPTANQGQLLFPPARLQRIAQVQRGGT